jgi:DNA-binding HxlR family transcriptional regulator
MDAPAPKACEASAEKTALVREMLGRVGDKWTLLVIDALDGEEALRFSRLQQRVGGISQRMLTKTLRQLECDGLVTRRVHPVVPPRVDYALTPLGSSLGESLCGLWLWVDAHRAQIDAARRAYDTSRGVT